MKAETKNIVGSCGLGILIGIAIIASFWHSLFVEHDKSTAGPKLGDVRYKGGQLSAYLSKHDPHAEGGAAINLRGEGWFCIQAQLLRRVRTEIKQTTCEHDFVFTKVVLGAIVLPGEIVLLGETAPEGWHEDKYLFTCRKCDYATEKREKDLTPEQIRALVTLQVITPE